jgi:hypothetical protein
MHAQQYPEHQFKTKDINDPQLKLYKMSMLSVSSLSGQRNNNNAKNNMVSVEREHHKDTQGTNNGWVDQTFGDNFCHNSSNLPSK